MSKATETVLSVLKEKLDTEKNVQKEFLLKLETTRYVFSDDSAIDIYETGEIRTYEKLNTYYNENPLFGDCEVKAVSKQEVIDRYMTDQFELWANESWNNYCLDNQYEMDDLSQDQRERLRRNHKDDEICKMTIEFKNNLTKIG